MHRRIQWTPFRPDVRLPRPRQEVHRHGLCRCERRALGNQPASLYDPQRHRNEQDENEPARGRGWRLCHQPQSRERQIRIKGFEESEEYKYIYATVVQALSEGVPIASAEESDKH